MSMYDTVEPAGSSGHVPDLVEDVDEASLQILESNVDFMSLLYCHLAACPPHGPFVFYSAMTLVERARRRYAAAVAAAASERSDLKANHHFVMGSSSPPPSHAAGLASLATPTSACGVYPMDAAGAAAVLQALTIPNVLALINRRYDTAHLSGWPLLYVPAEIRGSDVDLLIQQQQQQQQ